jgi:16S rRNA processing protein RimM
MKESRMIPVGRIARPHGVRGALKVTTYGESLAGLEAGATLFLPESSSLAGHPKLTVVSLRVQGKQLVVNFEGLETREEAQLLVGLEVFLPEERLPPAPEGEYYYYQLMGLAVETRDGKLLGIVRSIIEAGGNDVYVVEGEGKEILVPAVDEFVHEVDLERGRIVVELPEGLLEL